MNVRIVSLRATDPLPGLGAGAAGGSESAIAITANGYSEAFSVTFRQYRQLRNGGQVQLQDAMNVGMLIANDGEYLVLPDVTPPPPPPAPTGSIEGSFVDDNFASADLTVEGTEDWVHWGSTTVADRKNILTPILGNEILIDGGGTINNFDPGSLLALSWSDGKPRATGTGDHGFHYVGSDGKFQITAPADTQSRVLKLYLGNFNNGGKLTAHLSDDSAADFVSDHPFIAGSSSTIYTLTYKAATDGQTLTVTWANDIPNTGAIAWNGVALALG